MKPPRGSGRVYKPKNSSILHIEYYAAGQQIRESAHTTDERAAADLLRRKVVENRDVPLIETKAKLAVGADSLMRQYRADMVGREKDPADLDHDIAFIEKTSLGYQQATRVTTQMAQRWINQMKADGYANDTIARKVRFIRASYNYGKRVRIIRDVPYIPMPGKLHVRKGHGTDEQASAIAAAIKYRPSAINFEMVAVYGQRPAEPPRLQWWDRNPQPTTTNVPDGHGGTITITQEPCVVVLDAPAHIYMPESKSDERTLALDGHLLDLFVELRQLNPTSRWVFPSVRNPHEPLTYATAYDHVKAAMKVCGVVGRTWYDFKRTAIRRLSETVGTRLGMEITGHKTREMFDRYDQKNQDDQIAALRRLHERIGMNERRTSTPDPAWPCGYRDLQGLDIVTAIIPARLQHTKPCETAHLALPHTIPNSLPLPTSFRAEQGQWDEAIHGMGSGVG